ncbi:MAG: hypothetical protein SWQ30_11080 [Thermodesulfobacteriota bacterium]|nr:hypothetical protein [Thermodesulfobacteriota bacterium]
MKRQLSLLLTMTVLFGLLGMANADLSLIGTANYQGNDYNLIYEDDSIYGGLVWLDHTNEMAWHGEDDYWQLQVDWASGLNTAGELTYDFNPGVSISWGGDWRLPTVDESKANIGGGFGWEGPDETGYHDYEYGHNMVNSEMGHLHYLSLGNLGLYGTDGTNPQPGWGLTNVSYFANLYPYVYWTGLEWPHNPTDRAWDFHFYNGGQNGFAKSNNIYALAVRPAEVSTVPIPGAVFLLGSSLAGLVGIRRKFKH